VNQYLYAIVDRLPTRWRPPTAGIGGASVVPRRIDDVVLLGSLLDAVPPASPRTLALHQDVIATVLDAPATLPLSYGTTVPTAEVAGWLAVHRTLVAATLASVRGCVEMTVKLLCLEGALGTRLGPDRGHPHGGQSGPAERELRALAESLAERAGLPRWRYRPSGSAGNVAASVAFLVERAELSAFLARIAPVASHASGVAVVPTGPWAPYSFVPQLDRVPSVGAAAEPVDVLGRRAG
jgi:Gas vesicle synthesis protein GvpL/GvpF